MASRVRTASVPASSRPRTSVRIVVRASRCAVSRRFASATSYDIVRLASEYERLDARRLDLRSDLNRLGAEPAIRKLGLDSGLGQLDAPLIIPAR